MSMEFRWEVFATNIKFGNFKATMATEAMRREELSKGVI